MVRLLFKPALLLIALLSLAIVFVQPGPIDDSRLQAFLTAPENCGGRCLLGIVPGKTSVPEALADLDNSPWVTSVQMNANGYGYGQIRWQWSDQHPAIVDVNYPGRLTFYWVQEEGHGLDTIPVDTISVATSVRIFSMQSWYGHPDSGTANLRPDGDVNYSAAFHSPGNTLALSTVLRCPVSLGTFWDSMTKITISIGHGTTVYKPPVYTSSIC